MTIRTANIADAEALLAFLREMQAEGLETLFQRDTVPSLEEEQAFIGKFDATAGLMLLALHNDRVVGCLTAEVMKNKQLCHSCEFGVAVLKKERGTGVGTALIARLSEWAKSIGLRRIQLTVFAGNPDAIRLYRRLGYEVEGRKIEAIRIGDRYEDLVEMARRI